MYDVEALMNRIGCRGSFKMFLSKGLGFGGPEFIRIGFRGILYFSYSKEPPKRA